MKIIIDEQSVAWYREELDLGDGDSIRFFPRYGGYSPIQSGFSLGISPEPAKEAKALTEKGGLSFFVEEDDLWYFDGHDLEVQFDEKKAEPAFHYHK
ncbi:HesB/YadR/YfhF family protein [Gracilibacillus sp. Marseille-QA3620]